MCRSAQNFVQHVCGQLQPSTSARTNPTPDLTLTPTLLGARDRQGQSGNKTLVPRATTATVGYQTSARVVYDTYCSGVCSISGPERFSLDIQTGFFFNVST